MPRPKKIVPEPSEDVQNVESNSALQNFVVETVEPTEPVMPTEEDEVVTRVVNRLKKVVTIKRELSDKQKAHLESLASKKKGKKYVAKVDEKEIEQIPEVIVPAKVRKQRVVKPPPTPTPAPVPIKKRAPRVVIPKVQPAPAPAPVRQSYFKNSIF